MRINRIALFSGTALAAVVLAAGGLPRASAQADKDKQKSERVHFETVDEVELHGTYWPGGKGRRSPCVLLLHKLNGKGSHEEGWDLLADELAKKGFAVLSFVLGRYLQLVRSSEFLRVGAYRDLASLLTYAPRRKWTGRSGGTG